MEAEKASNLPGFQDLCIESISTQAWRLKRQVIYLDFKILCIEFEDLCIESIGTQAWRLKKAGNLPGFEDLQGEGVVPQAWWRLRGQVIYLDLTSGWRQENRGSGIRYLGFIQEGHGKI